MVDRIWKIGLMLWMIFILAACAPPSGLPDGPTPIPTLIPVEEDQASTEPTEPSFAILSYPVRPPSSSEGERIFAELCADCHGADGTGEVPGSRNFQDLDYMRGETPAAFYADLTEGRGDMPAYNDTLSSDERWDVVFYVWRHSTTSLVLNDGKQLYDSNCAICHGVDGSGELLGSADFTDPRDMGELAPRDLYLTVTQGRGSMPAWQSVLSQDQRWATIDYLRSFSYDPLISSEIGAGQASGDPSTASSTCSSDQPNTYAWDDVSVIEEGEALYLLQCALCHGADGSGGLPNTPDFTTSDVNQDLIDQPGNYFCSVSEGFGVMPSFKETLSGDEMWKILTFLGSVGGP
jgi:mono/diheme cytochrome c family protein